MWLGSETLIKSAVSVANKFEVSPPSFSEDDKDDTPNRKISSQRIMEELNWSPHYSSFVKGYESLLG